MALSRGILYQCPEKSFCFRLDHLFARLRGFRGSPGPFGGAPRLGLYPTHRRVLRHALILAAGVRADIDLRRNEESSSIGHPKKFKLAKSQHMSQKLPRMSWKPDRSVEPHVHWSWSYKQLSLKITQGGFQDQVWTWVRLETFKTSTGNLSVPTSRELSHPCHNSESWFNLVFRGDEMVMKMGDSPTDWL